MTLDDIAKEIEAHSPYPLLKPLDQVDNVVFATLCRPLTPTETRPGTHAAITITISQNELDQALFPLNLIYGLTQEAVRRLSGDAQSFNDADNDKEETPC